LCDYDHRWYMETLAEALLAISDVNFLPCDILNEIES
jgi:hypothetical protein